MSVNRRAMILAALLLTSVLAGCPEEGGTSGRETPAATRSIRNPLLDAKAEEWALYDSNQFDGEFKEETRIEVAEVRPNAYVSLKYVVRDKADNRLLTNQLMPVRPNHFLLGLDKVAVIQEVYFDQVWAAGRSWQCLCVETRGTTMGHVKSWYSPEVPALGLVKQVSIEADGQEKVKEILTDWSGKPR